MNLQSTKASGTSNRASYMVINPGESLADAAGRHRRDTGYMGNLHIVALNSRPRCSGIGSLSMSHLMAIA